MNMKPILFNTDMNIEIRAKRKNVTRRCVKYHDGYKQMPVPSEAEFVGIKDELCVWSLDGLVFAAKAPYQKGDVLYVRETYVELPVKPDGSCCEKGSYLYYKADGDLRPRGWRDNWKPSLHMPKHVARTYLKVTDVRVERLRDIFLDPPGPNNQIVREGFRYGCDFIAGWENTVKKDERHLYGYDANPWVWVIEFETYWPD